MEKINRSLLKQNAKEVLKRNFWMPLLVCLVASFLGGNWNGLSSGSFGGSSGFRSGYNSTNTTLNNSSSNGEPVSIMTEDMLNDITNIINDTEKGSDFYYYYDSSLSESDNIKAYYDSVLSYFGITNEDVVASVLMVVGIILLIIVIIWVIITVISFAIGSFVGAPIQIGYRLYFMKNREGISKFDDLFQAFSGGHYMAVVKNMFGTNIRMWAWGLLFYFPGLVYYYKTYMVPYIVSENPTMDPARARELSKQMTDGHKWQIFVLRFSFIGWIFLFILVEIVLALVSCGLLAIPGALLILPINAYMEATYAELYAERREFALHTGIATRDELPGFVPVANGPSIDFSAFTATTTQSVDQLPEYTTSSDEFTAKNDGNDSNNSF